MRKLLSMGTILALLWGVTTMWRRREKPRASTGGRTKARGRRATPRTRTRRQRKPAQRRRGPEKQPSRPENVPAEVEA